MTLNIQKNCTTADLDTSGMPEKDVLPKYMTSIIVRSTRCFDSRGSVVNGDGLQRRPEVLQISPVQQNMNIEND